MRIQEYRLLFAPEGPNYVRVGFEACMRWDELQAVQASLAQSLELELVQKATEGTFAPSVNPQVASALNFEGLRQLRKSLRFADMYGVRARVPPPASLDLAKAEGRAAARMPYRPPPKTRGGIMAWQFKPFWKRKKKASSLNPEGIKKGEYVWCLVCHEPQRVEYIRADEGGDLHVKHENYPCDVPITSIRKLTKVERELASRYERLVSRLDFHRRLIDQIVARSPELEFETEMVHTTNRPHPRISGIRKPVPRVEEPEQRSVNIEINAVDPSAVKADDIVDLITRALGDHILEGSVGGVRIVRTKNPPKKNAGRPKKEGGKK